MTKQGYWVDSWPLESRIAFIMFFGTVGGLLATVFKGLIDAWPWIIDWSPVMEVVRLLLPIVLIVGAFLIYVNGQMGRIG